MVTDTMPAQPPQTPIALRQTDESSEPASLSTSLANESSSASNLPPNSRPFPYSVLNLHSFTDTDPELHKALVDSAALCSKCAFEGDPFQTWVNSGEKPSDDFTLDYYRTTIEYTRAIPRSVCVIVNQPPGTPFDSHTVEVVSAAVTFPPGYLQDDPPTLDAAAEAFGCILKSLVEDPVYFWRVFVETADVTDEARKEHLGDNIDKYYFVHMVGTKAGHQGHGLDVKVLKDMLDRADADGSPCYLRSTNQKNVPFYKRLGFEEREVMTYFDEEKTQPYTAMLRQPKRQMDDADDWDEREGTQESDDTGGDGDEAEAVDEPHEAAEEEEREEERDLRAEVEVGDSHDQGDDEPEEPQHQEQREEDPVAEETSAPPPVPAPAPARAASPPPAPASTPSPASAPAVAAAVTPATAAAPKSASAAAATSAPAAKSSRPVRSTPKQQAPALPLALPTADSSIHRAELLSRLALLHSRKLKPLETALAPLAPTEDGFDLPPGPKAGLGDPQDFSRWPDPAAWTEADVRAVPMVLVVGQYSVGKTTFIKHLLGREYPGSFIGPEPTTDSFVAVMHGPTPRIIPGDAACVSPDLPFGGLARLGGGFLSRFKVSHLPHPTLSHLTLIDTPGLLSSPTPRTYDFPRAARWFADRADLVVLVVDPARLDVGSQVGEVVGQGDAGKVRVVLNKADGVGGAELMRCYGALMWSLARVFKTPEVVRVYVGSFWEKGYRIHDMADLLRRDHVTFMRDLADLPANSLVRKVNEMARRARTARAHAVLLNHLQSRLPLFASRASRAALIADLPHHLVSIRRSHGIPEGDLPPVEELRKGLEAVDWGRIRVDSKMVKNVEELLASDLPKMMGLTDEKRGTEHERRARDESSSKL
ncbi:hypothetical protein M427DRAFT_28904 [Gonapodya prolifera JEL478]|uniref:N-acetyltransferase domain-containing protein n=1 Tax=Gonapodya prolifera (strain JEL478) TaxID=1344416 RepID=A0A139ART0_GONPJ|nr:hypothetical protein M427DRAFT_28904 [Gonapodya prolifera JEL478]|eukprot:KXS19447.1 hypothetical protein M427DRAFT_28904 [Gonapodya prolifera JEL478]